MNCRSCSRSAAILEPRASLELILDGHHVNTPAAAMVFKSALSRVLLVTDAMSAAGASDGDYLIGSLAVTVENRIAQLASNNSLAGSTLMMVRAFFNFCNFAGNSILDAVHAT